MVITVDSSEKVDKTIRMIHPKHYTGGKKVSVMDVHDVVMNFMGRTQNYYVWKFLRELSIWRKNQLFKLQIW